MAHLPPGFPTCCNNQPSHLPAAPLGALAQGTFSFWLETPPAGRGTGCFP